MSARVLFTRRLTERIAHLLGEAGIDVRTHRQVPANDAGLCFGQVIETLFATDNSLSS